MTCLLGKITAEIHLQSTVHGLNMIKLSESTGFTIKQDGTSTEKINQESCLSIYWRENMQKQRYKTCIMMIVSWGI